MSISSVHRYTVNIVNLVKFYTLELKKNPFLCAIIDNIYIVLLYHGERQESCHGVTMFLPINFESPPSLSPGCLNCEINLKLMGKDTCRMPA